MQCPDRISPNVVNQKMYSSFNRVNAQRKSQIIINSVHPLIRYWNLKCYKNISAYNYNIHMHIYIYK